jgi:ubiquinone/menaquinone biosynthesis C-methylase UbiE
MTQSVSIYDLVQSHRVTAVIYAAAKLNLAEAMGESPKSVIELAHLVRANENALRRLLVSLTTLGLCERSDKDSFTMTDVGRQLGENANPTFKDWILFEGEMLVQSWNGLADSIRTGKTASQLRGEGDNRYGATEASPDWSRRFNAAMVNLTRTVVPKIVAACDFSGARVVMDVGGGTGELISGVLNHNPDLEGVAFDLVRCHQEAATRFERQGIASRCRFVAGDFFEAIPAGADMILMKSILHNWDDDRCRVILRNCGDALPCDGALIVIERIMPENATMEPADRSCVMSDLNMLRGPGGGERTESEYRALALSANFALVKTKAAGAFNLIEFRKSDR